MYNITTNRNVVEKFNSRWTDIDAFWEYPFSPLYGWVVDKFGVSWQVSFSGKEQTIVPTFMFANEKYGEAAKALSEWLAIFGPGEIIEKLNMKMGTLRKHFSHYRSNRFE